MTKESNVILNDFTESLLQVDIDPKYDVEIHSTKQSKWFLPTKITQFNKIVLSNKRLVIQSNNSSVIHGNLSVCLRNDFNTSVYVSYDIPNCCPCCPWYNVHLCSTYYKNVENCTTIILYSPQKFQYRTDSIAIYENNAFLLPCQMRLSNFKDNLSITEFMNNDQYIHYQNGNLLYKRVHFTYNPTIGLCFNSSELKEVRTYFECRYDDGKNQFILTKKDFSSVTIQSSLLIENRNKNFLYINNSNINLLENSQVLIQCKAKYLNNDNLNIIMCIKFEIVKENISLKYDCISFNDDIHKEILIDSTKIKNGSKIICLTTNPSKDISTKIETTIYKYNNKKLSIKNFEILNNKIFTISEEEFIIEIPIFFTSIPSENNVKCSFENLNSLKFEMNCTITIVEQCICRINTEKIILQKKEIFLKISIENENFKESVNISLKPIYLEKPLISGLISKIKHYQRISCNFNASKPFHINWNIEYNRKNKFVHSSVENHLNLVINNDTDYVCVTCEIGNEIGKIESDQVCKEILDVEMYDRNIIQIYIINSTIWTDKIESYQEIQFPEPKNRSINILDYQPIFIKCASRNKNEKIKMYLNNILFPFKNVTEKQSKFTRQLIAEFGISFLSACKSPLKILCRQNNFTDSTYVINVLRTITPSISLQGNNDLTFIGDQDIHLMFTLKSFPFADLKLFKIIEFNGNKSNLKRQLKQNEFKMQVKHNNKISSIIRLIFSNVSKKDSGEYSLIASNIKDTSSYRFSIKESKTPSPILKVYIILGSLIVFVILCLLFVIFYCKRSGYAIPIIQIQNNIYKSLDGDSLQLLNTIWPDPLERMRWVIKPSSRIKIKERIGGGNYGVVYTGIFKNPESSEEECVALKYPILTKPVNNDKPLGPSQFCQISLDCFINEIRILSQLTNCPNIIKMYGCTIFRDWINEKDGIREPTTMVVLEFCSNYSLSVFLAKHASSFAPYTKYRKFILPNGYSGMKMDEGLTLLDLKRITLGIATGLEYLNGLNIIHRDLAARNILIDERKTPKICDFGLAVELDNDFLESKSYQILTYNKALPYKILAPEALQFKSFYLESDIWSFSLLMWDIFNLEKEVIFPNINTPNDLLRHISSKLNDNKNELILPMPRYADESIWDLIKTCWYFNPFDRPSAHTIRNKLVEIVRNSPVEVIRVSSNSQSDIYDQICQESLGSSKCPSTHTSIITLNNPAIYTNNIDIQSLTQCNNDFSHSNQIDESLL